MKRTPHVALLAIVYILRGPLMFIDSYSPLLSQLIVRAGSRTSVDNLQRENPATFLPYSYHQLFFASS